jgi:hypothetical protein
MQSLISTCLLWYRAITNNDSCHRLPLRDARLILMNQIKTPLLLSSLWYQLSYAAWYLRSCCNHVSYGTNEITDFLKTYIHSQGSTAVHSLISHDTNKCFTVLEKSSLSRMLANYSQIEDLLDHTLREITTNCMPGPACSLT